MSIGAELGQYVCVNTYSKNSEDSKWGFRPPHSPLGYASDMRSLIRQSE